MSFVLVHAGPLRAQLIPTEPDHVDPEVFHALYSLDFDLAEQKLEALIDASPDSARLWNLLASSIWLKIVYEQEKLGLDNYIGNRLGNDHPKKNLCSGGAKALRRLYGAFPH